MHAKDTRWRFGDTNPVTVTVRRDIKIEPGECVFKRGQCVEPASNYAFTEKKESAAYVAFKKLFVGVALAGSDFGDLDQIKVATDGTFEFDCSEEFKIGRLVALDNCPDGGEETYAMETTQVQSALLWFSIGSVAKENDCDRSKVLVTIYSAIRKVGRETLVVADIEDRIQELTDALTTKPPANMLPLQPPTDIEQRIEQLEKNAKCERKRLKAISESIDNLAASVADIAKPVA